jgi:hypothetical protein
MKNYLLMAALSFTSLIAAQAQEYKVKRSTGKMIVHLSNAVIEGYSGNEIVFSSQRKETETDPKAEGLQTINDAGYLDNSGLGVSVVEKGNTVEVNEVSPDLDIKILVPKGLIVSVAWDKVSGGGKLTCRNMENEIEIETYDNIVFLENITGPLTVRTLYGSVDAVFRAPVKGPVFIASVNSAIDVAIPVDTKADIQLKSIHRTILTSPDLKIEMRKREAEPKENYGTSIDGKLNGGGTEFWLTSKYGKIYLRKTQ